MYVSVRTYTSRSDIYISGQENERKKKVMQCHATLMHILYMWFSLLNAQNKLGSSRYGRRRSDFYRQGHNPSSHPGLKIALACSHSLRARALQFRSIRLGRGKETQNETNQSGPGRPERVKHCKPATTSKVNKQTKK